MTRSPFFVQYCVGDGILTEVQWWPDCRRCRRASAPLASDHYQLFWVRSSRDPTLLSLHKISLWDTQLCVLGWDIDTVAMTISVPLEKLERLRDTLSEWSPDRVVASEEELRSLIGRLLPLCAVMRPAKYFLRHMLNQAGLPPVRTLSAKFHASHTRTVSPHGSTWVVGSTPTCPVGVGWWQQSYGLQRVASPLLSTVVT